MKNKDNLVSVVLIVVLILGLCMVLYPTFSNYWNSSRQTQVISTYEDAVSDMDKEDFEQYYYEVRPNTKLEVLCRLLDMYDPKLSLIFSQSRTIQYSKHTIVRASLHELRGCNSLYLPEITLVTLPLSL